MKTNLAILIITTVPVFVLSTAQSAVLEVMATVETQPVPHAGDRADDIAIWLHPTQPDQSIIIGTDKEDPKGGLLVYDLSGKQIFFAADGKMNNVDVGYDFPLGPDKIDIVVATNRTDDSIAIYKIDPATRTLVNVAARTILAGREEVYGICLYTSPKTRKRFVFIDNKDGIVDQWELLAVDGGKIDALRVRSFEMGSISEGIVADSALGFLYVGQEDVGLWKIGAEPDDPADSAHRTLVDPVGSAGHLVADIEGLTIYCGPDNAGYLIASSQGEDHPSDSLANSYAVYERQGSNKYLFSFRIIANSALNIDGVTNTDGIDVISSSLGSAFLKGVFVVQDGSNPGANQNYKLVPWESVARLINPPMLMSSEWNPRSPQCGVWGFFGGDLNRDCHVDMGDLAMLASNWLSCTDPDEPDRCVTAQ
jgi:3-phytase